MPSFNVQNAKALAITEGDVKTIHNSNGQLLWGAVGYSTKYAGDTEQQTYTGKNLCSVNTFDADTGNSTPIPTLNIGDNYYTVSFNIDSVSLGTNESFPFRLTVYDTGGSAHDIILITVNSDTTTGLYNFTFYVRYTIIPEYSDFNIQSSYYNNGARLKLTNIQIEEGSSPTSYEPYVGGIPSPNPDYPQSISVVTGTQTVTISDDTNTEDFTVSLGTTELCKIGDYQDYIWQDGADWKVHKAIGKQTYDGTESWSRQLVSNDPRYFYTDVPDALMITDTSSLTPIISDYYVSETPGNIYSGSVLFGVSLNSNTPRIRIRNGNYTALNDFKTWLTTHNTTVYYALATPTDTQITDASLIAQLNAIEAWLTRYGYTATVSGSLPLVITQTELT